MKKIALLGVILLCYLGETRGQSYQVEIKGGAIANRHNFECSTYVDIYFYTDKSTTPIKEHFEIDREYDKNSMWYFSRNITVNGKIHFIKCVGSHRDDPNGKWDPCQTQGSGEDEQSVSDSEYPCPKVRLGNGFMGEHDTGSYIDIKMNPMNIELSYFNTIQFENALEGVKYLPQDFPIKITATGGFLRSVYNWEYSIGNVYSWQSLDAEFINSAGTEINVSGSNMLSFEQMFQLLPVYFRINYTCGTSNTIELQPKIAAPKFNKTIKISNETCPWKRDGKILFEFNRNLLEGEEVEITGLTENNHLIPVDYEFLPPNQCLISGLEPGTHSFQLLGSIIDHHGTKIATSVVKNSEDYSFSQVIQAGVELKMELLSFTGLTCAGGVNGQISAKGEGGSGEYKLVCKNSNGDIFESNFLQSTMTVNNLSAGTYSMWVKDSNGCMTDELTDAVILLNPDNPIAIDAINCFHPITGEENGSVMVRVKGGTAPYEIFWKRNNAGGASLDNKTQWKDTKHSISLLSDVGAGSYYIELIDSNGCKISTTAVLEDLPPFDIQLSQTGTIDCYNDATGQLKAVVRSGGTAPYKYEWYQLTPDSHLLQVGENKPVLSNITAGTYRLKVIDSSGHEFWTESMEQTQPEPVTGSFQTENLHCYGDENGYIRASFTGGNSPYSYQWLTNNPGHTGLEINGLKAGDYKIQVTDASGCVQVFTSQVKQPDTITFSPKISIPSCNNMSNGSIQLDVKGGTAPYVISWSTGDNTPIIQSLTAGTYDVTVSDQYACESKSKQMQLTEPEILKLFVTRLSNVSAFGRQDGSAIINITGGSKPYRGICKDDSNSSFPVQGTNYPPNNPASIEIKNLPVGNYTLTVQDVNFQQNNTFYLSCNSEIRFSITEPPPLKISVKELHHVSCFKGKDGQLKVEIEGGLPHETGNPYNCKWYKLTGSEKVLIPNSENKTIIDNLPEGKYTVEAIDRNNISNFSEAYHLTNPDTIQFKFTTATLICNSDEKGWVEAIVTGGQGDFSYKWSTGEENTTRIDKKRGGIYSLTVTDERGCTISDSTEIRSPQSIKIGYELLSPLCSGHGDGSVSLSVKGGEEPYRYRWSNGKTTAYLNQAYPGQYDVRITDDNDCYRDTTFIIPEVTPVSSQVDTIIQPLAYQYSDGLLRVKITGGAGPYKIRWTNDAGIDLNGSLEYTDEAVFATLQQISEGKYHLDVEDNNYQEIEQPSPFDTCGCLHQQVFYMPQPPKLEVKLINKQYIQCHGTDDGVLLAEVKGGVPFKDENTYQYQWYKNGSEIQNNDSLISNLGEGRYHVKITDFNGIVVSSESFFLKEPAPLNLSVSAADLRCSRDKDAWAEVIVTGGTAAYHYSWSNGNTSKRIEQIGRGNYFVLVTDDRKCEITGNVKIIQPGAIQAKAELLPPTCYHGSNGEIRVSLSGGQAPYSYQWDNGDKSLVHSVISSGNHQLTVSDVNECSHEVFSFALSQPDSIILDLGKSWELCKDQTLEINASIPEATTSYYWFNETGNQLANTAAISLKDQGIYRAEVLTAKGCKGAGEIKITRTNKEIAADFVLASQVPVNEEIWVINISRPEPEDVEWILPQDSTAYQVLNSEFETLELLFTKKGEYTIGMKSFSGNCEKITYKTIQVMNKEDIAGFEDADEPMLKSFVVSPNPNKGDFDVKLELKEPNPVILQVVNSGSGNVVERRMLNGNKSYKEHFHLPNNSSGTYILNLYTPKVNSGLKMIIH